jgi:hypothetical protein
LKVKLIDAYIYHYGWVKPPQGLVRKGINFKLFYNRDAAFREVREDENFDYGNAGRLRKFEGTHPCVISDRIKAANWPFNNDLTKVRSTQPLRKQILQKIYECTGWRIGEYRNYTIVKR